MKTLAGFFWFRALLLIVFLLISSVMVCVFIDVSATSNISERWRSLLLVATAAPVIVSIILFFSLKDKDMLCTESVTAIASLVYCLCCIAGLGSIELTGFFTVISLVLIIISLSVDIDFMDESIKKEMKKNQIWEFTRLA